MTLGRYVTLYVYTCILTVLTMGGQLECWKVGEIAKWESGKLRKKVRKEMEYWRKTSIKWGTRMLEGNSNIGKWKTGITGRGKSKI